MARKDTTTIQADRPAVERAREICNENGWALSYVATRLLERFAAGEFSGSAADVLRSNAGKEPDAGGLNANNGVKG